MTAEVTSKTSEVAILKKSKKYVEMSNVFVGYAALINSETPKLSNNTNNITEEEMNEYTKIVLARIEVNRFYKIHSRK